MNRELRFTPEDVSNPNKLLEVCNIFFGEQKDKLDSVRQTFRLKENLTVEQVGLLRSFNFLRDRLVVSYLDLGIRIETRKENALKGSGRAVIPVVDVFRIELTEIQEYLTDLNRTLDGVNS